MPYRIQSAKCQEHHPACVTFSTLVHAGIAQAIRICMIEDKARNEG